MTMLTVLMRNGTVIKFDADTASTSPNPLNAGGFNYQFTGARVPKILHLRTEQVDAVLFGDVVIGDQLLNPQSGVPAAAPTPTAPTATPATAAK